MRDPAHGSDFTPDELDLLEDALEWVGDPGHAVDLAAMPAPLRQRADEYAAILAMTREAMPEEDVAPGLLDGILAEARRAAPPPVPAVEGPSLWERLRRSFLLPGVALAGTAALLLWVARPVDEGAPSIRDEAARAPAPAPAPAAPEPPRPSEEAAELEDMSPPTDRGGAPDDSEAAMAPAADAVVPGAMEPGPAPKAARPSMKAKKAEVEEAPLPGLHVPDQKRVDADKDSVRDQLESGDRARQKGRCDLAEAEYAAVASSNGPAAERARALAGLGLCREAAGKDADAERYFDEARALDSSVNSWLRGESEGAKKRSKSVKPKVEGL
ncbi:hypothetical protein [Nannocystis pusilla]|uniref:Tetratricopeptide repeat protein n=1 Tax=Nannocystis pusilla TaxID=889268 RepID=A0ABS7TQ34_9BACT|nr:hypothetical protein [Nannocystis pusilla]MBZ5710337.1 hypothetical protein [Nannocystis pusilla]